MGCGDSKLELNPGDISGTEGPRLAADVPRPRVPNDKVNSANTPAGFQYNTPRGNLQMERVNQMVGQAPDAPANRLREGRFPKHYRNQEGPRDNRRHNFSGFESGRPGQDPRDPRDGRLYEYPVKTMGQPQPLKNTFNFAEPPATLQETMQATQANHEHLGDLDYEPPNDPGALRAVTNKDGQVMGVIYHPAGNPRGYERARIEPLDAQGRAEQARYREQKLASSSTWPRRGPEPSVPE
ncbi:uncharacterized protein C8A04DRAFT_29786 [Dichotomopilus funicola]|uniref:Uncharacterized protein n=1 Tax=Dichotomopilus funicola TaxID=1934379 RepID=A0AAN6V0G3_9PEZI|nr:hypothetical protein C8A04DRAFT_29786 [Dichotomopilus funicola]